MIKLPSGPTTFRITSIKKYYTDLITLTTQEPQQPSPQESLALVGTVTQEPQQPLIR